MESNKDEAVKCLAIAQRRRNAGDLAGARRFCQKSLALFSTPEATKLLEVIESDIASADAGEASSSGSSAGPGSSADPEQPFASAAETHPSASGARHRHTGSGAGGSKANGNAEKGTEDKKRDYTPEQAAVVKRVRSCRVTEYYEILSVKKDCEEVEIKKAYRKVCVGLSLAKHGLTDLLVQLALSLHPDKNGAPGADEAFKSTFLLDHYDATLLTVALQWCRKHFKCYPVGECSSREVAIRSYTSPTDPQKRAAYDRHGSDPESRFSGMSSTGRAPPGFATNGFGGGGFESEISPEELFNMFFGGGMGSGPFGGTPFGGGPGAFTFLHERRGSSLCCAVFTASFGPGGFRTTNMRTNMRQVPQQANDTRSTFVQLLPLILLFAFSLLNFLPNLFSTPSTPDPRFSFTPSTRYNMERTTGGLGVKYHVNAAEFSGHPVAAELARNGNKPGPELSRFEKTVEQYFTQELYSQCQRGLDLKARRRDQELGLFGLGTDWEKVKRIEAEPVPSCEQLKSMGLLK